MDVYFAHRATPADQASAGFGVDIQWDTNLTGGFRQQFLTNRAKHPGLNHFSGCDNPEIGTLIAYNRFDAVVVLGWNLKAYWQAVLAAHRSGVPVLVRGDSHLGTPRGACRRAMKWPVYRVLFRYFDGCLAVGTRSREYFRHYGVPSHKIFTVPHSIDTGWFAERAREARTRREAIRAEMGFRPDDRIVLFAGKFIREKRIEDAIDACGMLSQRGLAVRMLMVGAGELGEALRDRVREKVVDARFAGFRNQSGMPEVYAISDVLVLPSRSETWGMVVNEAFACGLPAVVSDAAGCAPDLIVEGETGIVYPVGNISALADSIQRMLAAGSDPRVAAALARKTQEYSPARAADALIEAVRSVKERYSRNSRVTSYESRITML